ncbi:MAG TPA: HAMP domain-containing sensor histidine kinase [Patescibacteria group bacterium]|nr:HAMP domain-containing sensor histidine kinase [Gammaproteobacteria bacterium]HWA51536.1 HAMP domain-containing sensor histidine kinase [Patescibacteria group bacterium]
MKSTRGLFQKLWLKITRKAKDTEYQFIPLGVIGFVSFIAYYFIWNKVTPNEYQNSYLRLIGGLLCFFLIFHKYWPQKLKRILPLYWYFTLFYCFPFFFTFMLFKNSSSIVWLLTTMTGIFYLMLLVDWIDLLVIVTLGTLVSWICYVLTTDKIIIPTLFLQTLPTYATVFVAGKIFLYRTSTIQQEKLEAMKSVGATVAHELRTPLSAIAVGLDGVKDYFPTLIEGYSSAKEHGLPVKPISPKHYEILSTILDDLQSEAHYSNTIVDMILMNVKQGAGFIGNHKKCEINTCIGEAIQRYPFKSGEAALIEWDNQHNFSFLGDKVLIEHVLFNLMKNALYYIEAEGKGSISIWCEIQDHYNILYFKDTAKGIPSQALPLVFDRFYTTNINGTGLGLAFCRMVMTNLGGDISCASKLGLYTQFTLRFPKTNVKDEQNENI